MARLLRGSLRPPRTLRPTRAGWAFFALTLGVGVAALNTGNNLMYMVLALLLAFLVLSGVMSESALRGVRVRRVLPAELVAEQETIIGIEVANEQRRVPCFAVVVEDVVREGAETRPAGRAFALRVAPGAVAMRSYRFTPLRRGPLEFIGFRVATRFPFGLFSKALWMDSPRPTLAFPALDSLALPPPLRGRPRRGERRTGAGGHSPESAGLRAHAPGDPHRRVHWRASLRRGQLLVRDQEQDASGEQRVRLRTAGAAADARFEEAVRRAATEVATHLGHGRRVALLTDTARFDFGDGPIHRRRLLTHLALVTPDPPARAQAGS